MLAQLNGLVGSAQRLVDTLFGKAHFAVLGERFSYMRLCPNSCPVEFCRTVGTLGALDDDRVSQLLNQLVAKAKVAGLQSERQRHENGEHSVHADEDEQLWQTASSYGKRRHQSVSSSPSPPRSPRAGNSDSDNDNDGSDSSTADLRARNSASTSSECFSLDSSIGRNHSERKSPTALDKVDSIMEKGDSIVTNLLRTKSTIREMLNTGHTIVCLNSHPSCLYRTREMRREVSWRAVCILTSVLSLSLLLLLGGCL